MSGWNIKGMYVYRRGGMWVAEIPESGVKAMSEDKIRAICNAKSLAQAIARMSAEKQEEKAL